MFKRALVMGDPTFFRIKGGPNPHTRTRWGRRKKVRSERAIKQWKYLVDVLKELGAQVLIIPPVKDEPGMTYTANAGVVIGREDFKSFHDKVFLMSRLTPVRSGETLYYRQFLERLGFQMRQCSHAFEGEADLFPAGDLHIFTYGKVIRQRFAPCWGWPPYKRLYGFRSEYNMMEEAGSYIPPERLLPLELVDERFYHGDTVLCPFGEELQYLLAHPGGMSREDWALVRNRFGENVIALEGRDALKFAANSFYLESGPERVLLVPAGVSRPLLGAVRERGVSPVEIDVSEFFEKGGGSIKCLILDLGPVWKP